MTAGLNILKTSSIRGNVGTKKNCFDHTNYITHTLNTTTPQVIPNTCKQGTIFQEQYYLLSIKTIFFNDQMDAVQLLPKGYFFPMVEIGLILQKNINEISELT